MLDEFPRVYSYPSLQNVHYVTKIGNCNPLNFSCRYYEIRRQLANCCQAVSIFAETSKKVFATGKIWGLSHNRYSWPYTKYSEVLYKVILLLCFTDNPAAMVSG